MLPTNWSLFLSLSLLPLFLFLNHSACEWNHGMKTDEERKLQSVRLIYIHTHNLFVMIIIVDDLISSHEFSGMANKACLWNKVETSNVGTYSILIRDTSYSFLVSVQWLLYFPNISLFTLLTCVQTLLYLNKSKESLKKSWLFKVTLLWVVSNLNLK